MKIQALLVAAMLLTLGFGEPIAQTNSESRVTKLEETVRLLEQRIAALEAQLRERSVPVRVAPSKVNWRKLQKGMSEGDVEQLLGSPSKVDVFGSFSVWSYEAGGEVQFDADSRVRGWHER